MELVSLHLALDVFLLQLVTTTRRQFTQVTVVILMKVMIVMEIAFMIQMEMAYVINSKFTDVHRKIH